MNDHLTTNPAGIALIKSFEGFHATPYQDAGGLWTIGYGHTRTLSLGMIVTESQAVQLLQSDLMIPESTIKRLVTVTLGSNQFSALACFIFNVGSGSFATSTLLTLLNRGWYEQVPAQLARWNRVNGQAMPGLTRRRAAEGVLWSTPDTPPNVDATSQGITDVASC